MASREQRIEDALHELLQAIDDGGEYPDHIFRLTRKFNITSDELQEAYDPASATRLEPEMKLYVYDKGLVGAYIVVAASAKEAAKRLNQKNPHLHGYDAFNEERPLAADDFTEYELTDIVRTVGDIFS